MKTALLVAVILTLSATAGSAALAGPAPTAQDADLHAPFDVLLAKHVSNGAVDYRGLSDDREALRDYLAALSRTDPAKLDKNARMAFWLNAYNAFTLELILDHHGRIDSIKDISSGKRWKAERWLVNGQRHSLDEIEHEILRPMGDARVHFALVCASFSCPDLRSEAYRGDRLDTQLDEQAVRFLSNEQKGLRTVTEDGFFGGDDYNVYLSSLFDWFEEDFERDAGSVLDYVLRYAPESDRAYIKRYRGDLDVEWMDYDWSLNER